LKVSRASFADVLVYALCLACTVVSAALVYGGEGQLFVRIDGEDGSWIYPLSDTAEVTVDGPLGQTVVELRDGAARIKSSPCPNQMCVRQGKLHAAGQSAACLPNRVVAAIERRGGSRDVDAAAW
jgi:hypothetical protein